MSWSGNGFSIDTIVLHHEKPFPGGPSEMDNNISGADRVLYERTTCHTFPASCMQVVMTLPHSSSDVYDEHRKTKNTSNTMFRRRKHSSSRLWVRYQRIICFSESQYQAWSELKKYDDMLYVCRTEGTNLKSWAWNMKCNMQQRPKTRNGGSRQIRPTTRPTVKTPCNETFHSPFGASWATNLC